MWDTLVVPVVVGISVVYGEHLLVRDSRRSRILSVARQELETADLLGSNTELAARLRDRADRGIERYLSPRGLETPEGKARLASFVVILAVTILGLGMIAARSDGDFSFWENVAFGAMLGFTWLVADAAIRPLARWLFGIRK